MEKLKNTLSKFGPGLLYAGAAVGVSHLVQSTRAGAQFGFSLVWVVILSNIIKYPFFQIGPRYTAMTGKNLLDGYRKLGLWAIVLFFFISLSTMFIIQGAITVVTAGLLEQLLGYNFDIKIEACLILSIATIILLFGRYSLLDKMIKFIIILLSVTTVISVTGALGQYAEPQITQVFSFSDSSHMLFLFALVGWMPAPIDLSVWHSMWAEAKNKQAGTRTSLKDSMLDFNVGFIGTAILALGFLSLGALVMYGSGEQFPSSAASFAGKLISLYTQNLGSWSYPVIALACFCTMLSTTLTVLDAYPRMMRKMSTQLLPDIFKDEDSKSLYNGWVIFMAVGTGIFLLLFLKNMRAMVDFATIIAFVIAPVNALLNYLAIQDKDLPREANLGPKMKIFSIMGLIFLTIFAGRFLVELF